MTVCARKGQWTGLFIGTALLCVTSATGYAASNNIWQDTFGQNSFQESRSWPGQMLAGTAWEGLLEPGTTYEIRFKVNRLDGVAAVQVGDRTISIDRTGWHAHDFKVWDDGKRRMRFIARRQNVTAAIADISVKPKWQPADPLAAAAPTASAAASTGPGVPKGHYLTFARERDLQRELLRLVNQPHTAPSSWHLGIAQDLHEALTTPGVRGFSMRINWGTLETGDGRFDWRLMDANMAVARQLGLKFIVQVATRGFERDDPMPRYFPSEHRVWAQSGNISGYVAKIWDPWVRARMIRLHQQIARRYADDPAFGGIATTESAVGSIRGGNYSLAAYRTSMQQIVTETQRALRRGKLFWYLNFIQGGANTDMRRDERVQLVNSVPHHALAIGAPDITPDAKGMPGSLSSYRIHVRRTHRNLDQFCHLQHVDQGLGGINRKSNRHRNEFRQRVQRQQGRGGVFVFDDLRDPRGRPVNEHPQAVVGQLWHPQELFQYANRNFDCDYFFWHYRENVHNLPNQFWWDDIRPIIISNQSF